MEDRSALFDQLKGFSQRKLKKVETKVVTGTGEQLVEKRGAKGLQVLTGGQAGGGAGQQEPARKLDLQVGLVLPGLLFGSQDVAQDKSSLETYGITHILNLDRDVANKFEDDFNYKTVAMQDRPDFELDRVLDECFDFIDDGRHYGNVLVHCSGTVGLSRSTAVCVAYLMSKDKQGLGEAFNNVKEVRSFVKPNEGFLRQLKDFEVKLRGAQAVKESGIDDPFALRKKQEIEQEKAMVAGAASVKNRMKMFGATLDTADGPGGAARSKSVSPSPYKQPTSAANTASKPAASKWSTSQTPAKSATPEPRTSWQQPRPAGSGPPPPPPPLPNSDLFAKDTKPASRANTTTTTRTTSSSNKSSLPPPPPPPPAAGDLKPLHDKSSSTNKPSRYQPDSGKTSAKTSHRTASISSEASEDESGKRVFGRRPPPPMKIRGGLSIERQDSTSNDRSSEPTSTTTRSSQPQLRIENFEQIKSAFGDNRSSQCMTATLDCGVATRSFGQRCPSPLVLLNNVAGAPRDLAPSASSREPLARGPASCQDQPLETNPFEYWQRTLERKKEEEAPRLAYGGQAPKRTVSLGPKRPRQIGDGLMRSPFISRQGAESPEVDRTAAAERRNSFSKAANELQSSLTDLSNLIHSSELDARGAPRQKRPFSATPPPVPPHQRPAGSHKPPPAASCGQTSTSTQSKCTTESPPTRGDDQCNQENKEQRFLWQEDLANWKSSSSVNDLRSMWDKPKSTGQLPPPASVASRPRLNSTSLLKRTPWQNMAAAAAAAQSPQPPQPPQSLRGSQNPESDYAIRRTASTASSLKTRPVLRNPYRSQYG